MKIGQIVFVDDTRIPHIQTGVIVRKEYDPDGLHNWYRVLCNDGQNHVLPAFLLSPASSSRHPVLDKNKVKNFANKAAKFMQACTKTTHT